MTAEGTLTACMAGAGTWAIITGACGADTAPGAGMTTRCGGALTWISSAGRTSTWAGGVFTTVGGDGRTSHGGGGGAGGGGGLFSQHGSAETGQPGEQQVFIPWQ